MEFEKMSSKEISTLKLKNEFRNNTQYSVDRFEDLLEHFKGRVVINLDRCWQYWEEIVPIIEKHGMREQILLKSPCKIEWIKKASEIAEKFAYMPIIVEDIEPFYEMGGAKLPGYIGAELVFSSEDSQIIKNNVVERLHKEGKIAWGNAIQFSQEKVLSAGHTDDISITDCPEKGWGWLLSQGFDIIQTDWVGLLKSYITKCHKFK